MSESLKDQLKALGLAPSKPSRKKPRKTGGDISLDEAWRQKARTEKKEVEDQRRKRREQDLERRRLNARIQSLIEPHKLNDPAAELKRNFMYKDRIRSVLVTAGQLKSLNAGELGLVFLRGSYIVLPPDVVAQVRALSPDHVPDLGGGADEADEEHPVPDDLVW